MLRSLYTADSKAAWGFGGTEVSVLQSITTTGLIN